MVTALPDVKYKQLSQILAEIALETGVSVENMKSISKRALFVRARYFFALRSREHGYTLLDIGEAINRTHTTILELLKRNSPDKENVQKGEKENMDKAELKRRIKDLTKEERKELVATIAEEGTKEERDNLAALFSGVERGRVADASQDAASGGSSQTVRTDQDKKSSWIDDL